MLARLFWMSIIMVNSWISPPVLLMTCTGLWVVIWP